MHGVIVTVQIDAARAAEAEETLNTIVVPQAKQAPGFVRGTWLRSTDGTHGQSLLLMDSEDAAKALASRIAEQGPPPGVPVTFVSAEVYEVLAQA